MAGVNDEFSSTPDRFDAGPGVGDDSGLGFIGDPQPVPVRYCGHCGTSVSGAFCQSCGAATGMFTATAHGAAPLPHSPSQPQPRAAPPISESASAGWYPSPDGAGQRWWDGRAWQATTPGLHGAAGPFVERVTPQPLVLVSAQKSSGIATLLTILWPGGGHLYLGLTQKALPYVIANAIGFVLAWTLVLMPISVLIWLVTLIMVVGSVAQDTVVVNQALQEGRPIIG